MKAEEKAQKAQQRKMNKAKPTKPPQQTEVYDDIVEDEALKEIPEVKEKKVSYILQDSSSESECCGRQLSGPGLAEATGQAIETLFGANGNCATSCAFTHQQPSPVQGPITVTSGMVSTPLETTHT